MQFFSFFDSFILHVLLRFSHHIHPLNISKLIYSTEIIDLHIFRKHVLCRVFRKESRSWVLGKSSLGKKKFISEWVICGSVEPEHTFSPQANWIASCRTVQHAALCWCFFANWDTLVHNIMNEQQLSSVRNWISAEYYWPFSMRRLVATVLEVLGSWILVNSIHPTPLIILIFQIFFIYSVNYKLNVFPVNVFPIINA